MPVLINIPHSSRFIPEAELNFFTCDLQRELDLMTDHFTDDLFNSSFDFLKFPVSRLVCDVERFRNDEEEIMAKRGMGAIYTATANLKQLRVVSPEHKAYLLKKYYDPYHLEFELKVKEKLEKFNKCLIVDAHSFSAIPLTYEDEQNPNRPDICIGTDDYHTSPQLCEALRNYFSFRGYKVAINKPFAGAIVPLSFYQKDKRVSSIMIELNRGLYLNSYFQKNENYPKLKADIAKALRELVVIFDGC